MYVVELYLSVRNSGRLEYNEYRSKKTRRVST